MPNDTTINQTSIHIKAYLYDRMTQVSKDYAREKNDKEENPFFSDFEQKILLLCEVPEDYKGEKICNATA